MRSLLSYDKRRRAAAFRPRPCPTPDVSPLEVHWANAFDRHCFLVSTPGLPAKHPQAYSHLMRDLMSETGCTEDEILAHGNKVRRHLNFTRDELRRAGAFAGLVGRQVYIYDLAPVRPAF